jgi:hypothetical protein
VHSSSCPGWCQTAILLSLPMLGFWVLIFSVLGFELRASCLLGTPCHLSRSASPILCWVFSRQGLANYLPQLASNTILLITASQVGKIRGMSHRHPADLGNSVKLPSDSNQKMTKTKALDQWFSILCQNHLTAVEPVLQVENTAAWRPPWPAELEYWGSQQCPVPQAWRPQAYKITLWSLLPPGGTADSNLAPRMPSDSSPGRTE